MGWWPYRQEMAGHPFRGFRRSHKRSFELSKILQHTERTVLSC